MKNYVQDGETLTYTATAAVTSGQAVPVGTRVGVAATSGLAGDKIELAMEGVFALPKTAGVAIAQGTVVYITAAGEANTTAAGNTLAGYAHAAAAAGDATVNVKLLG